jgi:(E)-4-hydroxy-3-methylbut-2-enyl-diphosphate synthase
VTEAGDGEDGRIKGAIGIGSLLLDGLGDTIRVSLTEDSVYEIPVAQAIAAKAMSLWTGRSLLAGDSDAPSRASTLLQEPDSIDPYHFTRRVPTALKLSARCLIGPEHPPRVIVRLGSVAQLAEAARVLAAAKLKDTPAEGLLVPISSPGDLATLCEFFSRSGFMPDKSGVNPDLQVEFLALELAPALSPEVLQPLLALSKGRLMLVRRFDAGETETFAAFADLVLRHGQFLAADIAPENFPDFAEELQLAGDAGLVFTLSSCGSGSGHAIGAYRQLVECLRAAGSHAPIWIRNTAGTAVQGDPSFLSKLLEASFLTGSLLCDGIGDLVSIETEADLTRATKLAYNVLQGAGARISKTEFVACPSCGRTLFDLQTTTQRIRAQTGHLKGVKLAIMGCIVNGPGEMADADFGYVGGAPGKINLYVGKNCVQYNIPQAEADARLIALIKEHGKWVEPEPHQASPQPGESEVCLPGNA